MRGSEPVDERRALDGDRGLAPQASQVAVRLERRRPASTLKPSLPVLYQAGQQRSRGDATAHLSHGRHDVVRRHPISPEPRGGQQHDDSQNQVGDVRRKPPALQLAGAGSPRERDACYRSVDALLDEVRHAAGVREVLHDTAAHVRMTMRRSGRNSELEDEAQRLREAGARPGEPGLEKLSAGPRRRWSRAAPARRIARSADDCDEGECDASGGQRAGARADRDRPGRRSRGAHGSISASGRRAPRARGRGPRTRRRARRRRRASMPAPRRPPPPPAARGRRARRARRP